jgi:hypothetical protein
MIITIDSNVPAMPRLIINSMPVNAREWCPQFNKCSDITKEANKATTLSTSLVYYNTPISMSDNIKYYNMRQFEPNMYNFIYIDQTHNHQSCNTMLKRIKDNLNETQLKNVVFILGQNDMQSAMQKQTSHSDFTNLDYILVVGHCDNRKISEIIASIITMHVYKRERLSEMEIIELLEFFIEIKDSKNKSSSNAALRPQRITSTAQPTIIDIYNVLNVDKQRFKETNDCTVCSAN